MARPSEALRPGVEYVKLSLKLLKPPASNSLAENGDWFMRKSREERGMRGSERERRILWGDSLRREKRQRDKGGLLLVWLRQSVSERTQGEKRLTHDPTSPAESKKTYHACIW